MNQDSSLMSTQFTEDRVADTASTECAEDRKYFGKSPVSAITNEFDLPPGKRSYGQDKNTLDDVNYMRDAIINVKNHDVHGEAVGPVGNYKENVNNLNHNMIQECNATNASADYDMHRKHYSECPMEFPNGNQGMNVQLQEAHDEKMEKIP